MDQKGGPAQVGAPVGAGRNLLFLREEELRLAQDLLFFGYRDFTAGADEILAELGMGRAHHRVLHFVGRRPGITVGDLLGILGITKQSLARVLTPLMRGGLCRPGDRPQRPPPAPALADPEGARRWSGGCSSGSANGSCMPIAKPGRSRSRASAASCAG